MEQRSEPSTEEIVKALRELVYEARRMGKTTQECSLSLLLAWAEQVEEISSHLSDATDRLVSQNQENEELKGELDDKEEEIIRLTASLAAETARADAAVRALTAYEDALFDERDVAYSNGYSDGYQDGTRGT